MRHIDTISEPLLKSQYETYRKKTDTYNNNPKNKITQLLDECLLSDSDLLSGKDHWAKFQDPFPAWGEEA